MDPFNDQSMLNSMSGYGNDLMDASMMNSAMDLGSYTDDMQIDMGDVSAVPFNSVEGMSGTLTESEHQQHHSNQQHQQHQGEANMSGAGAGPLPTGFGAQVGPMGSTLTEFTKRRNWSQRVIEEIKDLLYILTPDARFLWLSPSLKLLTGYDHQEVTGKFIHDFIHPDDSSLFLREFNESIATGHALRMFYRLRAKDTKYQIFECHGHPHLTNDVSHLELTGGPRNNAGFCAGFFIMSRPYPTKNAVLLDSFLEHKLENERLQARIAVLRREEAEEAEAQARHFHKKATGAGSLTPSVSANEYTAAGSTTVSAHGAAHPLHGQGHSKSVGASATHTGALAGPPHPNNTTTSPLGANAPGDASPSITSDRHSIDFGSMPPPAKPTVSNMALTREALDEANAFARPDSITDKMARYEGNSHVDSIEMLTGLRYREGERSHGISTGGTSPALIRGDAGIDIPADKSAYGAGMGGSGQGVFGVDGKKAKKVKSADEYVCTDCGTLDSPEWRKGPNGPKTLCNACGLRWAKKEKKKSGSMSGGVAGGMTGSSGGSGNMSALHGTAVDG